MTPRLSLGLPAIVALLVLAVACSSETSGTLTSTHDSSIDFEVSPDPLPPGTYSSDVFVPPVTFNVTNGWLALEESPDLLTIQQRGENSGPVTLMLADVTWVQGEDGRTEPATAEEAATVVQANPELVGLGTSDSLMDGRGGFVVEVENTGQGPSDLLLTPDGTVTVGQGHRNWIALFDTSSGILAMIVDAPADTWKEALAAAEGVLETVTMD